MSATILEFPTATIALAIPPATRAFTPQERSATIAVAWAISDRWGAYFDMTDEGENWASIGLASGDGSGCDTFCISFNGGQVEVGDITFYPTTPLGLYATVDDALDAIRAAVGR